MAFDGIVTSSIVEELKKILVDGKVSKIYQHEKDEITLQVRNKGTNYKLLISADSNYPRIYITNNSYDNPASPPNFCMVLRKHLTGGKILDINQYKFDRVIHIDISSMDELGEFSTKRLIIEIMGRHSNIILLDYKNNKIIDSIKKVGYGTSRIRQVLPGLVYENPPSQNKFDPRKLSRENFINLLNTTKDKLPIFKFFYSNYQGLSPLISKEICFQASLEFNREVTSLKSFEIDDLFSVFLNISTSIRDNIYYPTYIEDDYSNIIEFHSLNLEQFPEYKKHHDSSISKVLDISFSKQNNSNRIQQKSQSIKRTIQTRLDRESNKLSKQKNELLISQDRIKYKIYADLISANIYKIPERTSQVFLENFYEDHMPQIQVPLDDKFSAIENAQRYYKRFSKLKNAESILAKQIKETEEEILYLENTLLNIDNALEIEDLNEILEELIDEGYIKFKGKNKKTKDRNRGKSSPHHYISRDNYHIFVGKNNKQNEFLTLRKAQKDDLWLHVQNMPGSHVIIKRQDDSPIPDSTLEEAALLAAYYSKARQGSNIPVDYTEKKNVKKIPRSKPGLVRYENFSTLIVSPTLEKIHNIRKKLVSE